MDTRVQTELDLIGAIYDAVIDPTLWDDTIDRIRRHLGFQTASVSVLTLPEGRFLVNSSSNIPEPYASRMLDYGPETVELWGGTTRFAMTPKEEPLVLSDVNPRTAWEHNRYFEEWGKPQGLVDLVALILEYSPQMVAAIGMGLHEATPTVTDEQIEGLRVLAPHLRRAAVISGLLDRGVQAAASFEGALSSLGSAVVLVDERMHIVYANALADQMLHAGDPLARMNDRLHLPRELVRGQLEAAVAAAAVDASGLQRGSGIPVHRGDGSGMIVHVLPLQRRQVGNFGAAARGQPVAAVFVAEPDSELNLPIEAIQLLYRLRPAETRVFELIASGLTAPRIARSLGISPNTVKTHTLRLFDKLGVHSRAELLRFARNSSLGPARASPIRG